MDKRKLTEQIARFLAECGAAYIVKEVIKNNVTTPTRIDKRIALVVGAFAIGGFVTLKASSYIGKFVDDCFVAYDVALHKTDPKKLNVIKIK